MPKFKVGLLREVWELTTIEIEAENRDAAERQAVELASSGSEEAAAVAWDRDCINSCEAMWAKEIATEAETHNASA